MASPLAAAGTFNLSNTLGDHMVLQRGPRSAVVWGFGAPGLSIVTTLGGKALGGPPAVVGADGIWRQSLPPQEASTKPTSLSFHAYDGSNASLRDVLFGDVYLCGGQSNMQYTPRSINGMNNETEEVAAADGYGGGVRLFNVGMVTQCGDPAKGFPDCSEPFPQLDTNIPQRCNRTAVQHDHDSCRMPWTPASSNVVGGQAWDTFSAVCWLTGKQLFDRLGGGVPIGLISSNWGGSHIQSWQPAASCDECGYPKGAGGGWLYNSMIAPFTVGPMALRGATWYQGESNVDSPKYYACGFPSMIRSWRDAFGNPDLWFGFVQVAGYQYSKPRGPGGRYPETDHSHAAADLRQAQLSGLTLPLTGVASTIDTGDWLNSHPPDKQAPSLRLAEDALRQVYKQATPGAQAHPLFASSALVPFGRSLSPPSSAPELGRGGAQVTVEVSLESRGGQPVLLTSEAPLSATQSSTLGKAPYARRDRCVTSVPSYNITFPQDCGYPVIYGMLNGIFTELNATAVIGKARGKDGSDAILLSASAPAGFVPIATSYGRASWPLTTFFSVPAQGSLPVLPWFSAINATDPVTPPVPWAHWPTAEGFAPASEGFPRVRSVPLDRSLEV